MTLTASIKVVGSPDLIRRFTTGISQAKKEIRKNLLKAGSVIQAEAKTGFKARGQKNSPNPAKGANTLRVQSGQLRRSIIVRSKGSGTRTVVEVGPTVRYGAIHEFGGTIRPIRKQFLTFKIAGGFVNVRQVRIPKRPYLAPALKRSEEKIQTIIGNAFRPVVA